LSALRRQKPLIVGFRGSRRFDRPGGHLGASVTNRVASSSLLNMSIAVHVRDRELLRRTRDGDPEAFGDFYRRRRGDLLAYLRVRVPTAELAMDLMCETFVKALVVVHDQERELPTVPLAWLLTMARNELIDAARRGHVDDSARQRLAMEPLQLSDRDLDAVDEAAADADLLDRLREGLPQDQSQALIARVLEDREYAEIAAELRTSESVIRKRVSRALSHLRTMREEIS
jgi:RNA polymerase sigma factor (sigma-70 family)